MKKRDETLPTRPQLVSGATLLELLWDARCRPSLRWLYYQQAKGNIPCVRIGSRVWYDPETVRTTLLARCQNN